VSDHGQGGRGVPPASECRQLRSSSNWASSALSGIQALLMTRRRERKAAVTGTAA
jgi:hypothetical protein